MPMPISVAPNTDLETDLAYLTRAPIHELRERWRAIFLTEPPPAFGPDLLRRSTAYRLQEQHYGGLTASVQRQLNQLIKALAKNGTGHIHMPKRVKSGAVLVRLWKGGSHRVMVIDSGFAFEGRAFPSGKYDDQIDALSQFLNWRTEAEMRTTFEFDFGHEDPGYGPPSPDELLWRLKR